MKVNNLNKEIMGRTLFKNVSFDISVGDKVGIIGVNGSGKTTLLNTIAKNAFNKNKTVELSSSDKLGYFKQEANFKDLGLDIEEYIKQELNIIEIEERLKELEINLQDEESIQEYSELLNEFLNIDGYNFDYHLNKILNGFGIQNKKNTLLENLSGGERSKVLLAKTLLENPTIMLLDEPTNNFDLKSLIWLENYLKDSKSTMLIVSHDRRFLDNIVNKIFEIDHIKKEIIQYNGNYTEYKEHQEKLNKSLQEQYVLAMEEKKKIKAGLKIRKDWSDRGRIQEVKDRDKLTRGYERDRSKALVSNNKGLLKRLEYLETIEKPIIEPKLELKFNLDKSKGNRDIFLNDITVGYKDVFETKKIKENIKFGDRIRIIGNNAKGKTTLLKTILGQQEPLSGEIQIGSGIKFGYIPQDNIFLKEDNKNIEELLLKYVSPENDLGTIYGILNNFRIKYYEKNKKISDLSPGERTRLKLVEFQLQDVNCLVLDEVSNHLDIEAIESIEEAIQNFKGTVIIVSHDRSFIENLNIEKEIDIETGKIKNLKYKEKIFK